MGRRKLMKMAVIETGLGRTTRAVYISRTVHQSLPRSTNGTMSLPPRFAAMAPHPSLNPKASSTPADQASSATSKAGNFMADSSGMSKAGARAFMEGRSSTSHAGTFALTPDSVPYVRARKGNYCFFGTPSPSPSYSDGYRALYENDELNLMALYESTAAPSPKHGPPPRPRPEASLFSTPTTSLLAPGLVLPPPRPTGGNMGSNAPQSTWGRPCDPRCQWPATTNKTLLKMYSIFRYVHRNPQPLHEL